MLTVSSRCPLSSRPRRPSSPSSFHASWTCRSFHRRQPFLRPEPSLRPQKHSARTPARTSQEYASYTLHWVRRRAQMRPFGANVAARVPRPLQSGKVQLSVEGLRILGKAVGSYSSDCVFMRGKEATVAASLCYRIPVIELAH